MSISGSVGEGGVVGGSLVVGSDSVCGELASFAFGLRFGELPVGVVDEAKRRVIDTLGCGFGGFDNPTARIARELAAESGDGRGARVLGLTDRSSTEMAAFANAVMVRYQDINDANKAFLSGGHPSDTIPAVLAVADAHHLSGQEALVGVVAAYQGFGSIPVYIKKQGWDQGILVAVGVAMGVGAMLGLSENQIRNAISLSVTPNIPLCVTRRGQLSMWKSCASGATDRSAIFATRLAAKGMTGPGQPFVGTHGLFDKVTGEFEVEVDPVRHGYHVTRSDIKRFPSCGSTQAVLATWIEMTKDLEPDDVEAVDVETNWGTWFETGREPEKWDPASRETADHSLPYVMATALRDGDVTLESYSDAAIGDPELRPLMAKIRITESPELSALHPAQTLSDITITTRTGRRLETRTGIPLGDHRNPLSDTQLEQKFRAMAEPVSTTNQIDTVLEQLWNLDTTTDTATIMDTWATAIKPAE